MTEIMEFSASTIVGPIPYIFMRQQVAISQASSNLNLVETRATTGTLNVVNIVFPWLTKIVGMASMLTAANTAGGASALVIRPVLNGTAAALASLSITYAGAGTNKTAVPVNPDAGDLVLAIGNTLGVQITSSGTYAPVTNDLYVVVWAVHKDLRW